MPKDANEDYYRAWWTTPLLSEGDYVLDVVETRRQSIPPTTIPPTTIPPTTSTTIRIGPTTPPIAPTTAILVGRIELKVTQPTSARFAVVPPDGTVTDEFTVVVDGPSGSSIELAIVESPRPPADVESIPLEPSDFHTLPKGEHTFDVAGEPGDLICVAVFQFGEWQCPYILDVA